MTDYVNQAWYDGNRARNYPLVDDASRLDSTGLFQLPVDLLVDLRLTAPSTLDPALFHVLSVTAYGTGLVVVLGNNGTAVGTVTIPTAQVTEYQAFSVAPLSLSQDVGGSVVVGGSAAVLAASQGSYSFSMVSTRIIPTLVSDPPSGVTGLTVVDPFGGATRLTGAVSFTAGSNATLSVSGQNVALGLLTGVVLGDPCACLDQQGNQLPAVTTINGVGPDAFGNVQLVADTGCVTFSSTTGGLSVKDTCATPCCGSPEIRQLAESARTNNQHIGNLGNKLAEIEAAIRGLESAVLA